MQALCNYYGNGDVLVAAIRPLTNETFFDAFGYTCVPVSGYPCR